MTVTLQQSHKSHQSIQGKIMNICENTNISYFITIIFKTDSLMRTKLGIKLVTSNKTIYTSSVAKEIQQDAKNAKNRATLIHYRLARHTICHMRRRLKNKSYIHQETYMSFPNRSILYDPTTLQGLDKEMLGDKIQIALRMTVIAKMRKRER